MPKASTKKKTAKKKSIGNNESSNVNTLFEKVVADIYAQLEPQCEVKHNEMILGRDSEVERQIDVTIRSNIAGSDMLMIIQCKNHKNKVDVNKIGEFYAVMKDVGAHRGVMVSKVGFSKAAITYGKRHGIDCCQIHDGESTDWKLLLQIPILIKSVVPQVSVKIVIYSGNKVSISNTDINKYNHFIFDSFVKLWNEGKVPVEEDTVNLPLECDYPDLEIHDGIKLSVKSIIISYTIRSTWRFGYIDELPKTKILYNNTKHEARGILDFEDLSVKMSSYPKFDSFEMLPKHIKDLDTIHLLALPPLTFESSEITEYRRI